LSPVLVRADFIAQFPAQEKSPATRQAIHFDTSVFYFQYWQVGPLLVDTDMSLAQGPFGKSGTEICTDGIHEDRPIRSLWDWFCFAWLEEMWEIIGRRSAFDFQEDLVQPRIYAGQVESPVEAPIRGEPLGTLFGTRRSAR
jgi:hypothetical protein